MLLAEIPLNRCLTDQFIIYIYIYIQLYYIHIWYLCVLSSFFPNRQKVTQNLPPAILVSKKKTLKLCQSSTCCLFFSEKMTSARWPAFFFGFEKSTVVEAIPFRARRGASNRWTALFIRFILCRRRTKATWRSWRWEKKPVKNDVPTALVSPSKWV